MSGIQREFPSNRYACHSCNVTSCVNPRHVYPATQSENIKYAVECGTHFTPFRKEKRNVVQT
jgi:hypothetical protein